MFVEYDIFLNQRLVLIRDKVTWIWSSKLKCRNFINSVGYRFCPTFVHINSVRYLFMLILPIVSTINKTIKNLYVSYIIRYFFLMNSIGTPSLPSIDFLQVKRSFWRHWYGVRRPQWFRLLLLIRTSILNFRTL